MIQQLDILGTFLSIKKKIIINQYQQVMFGVTIILNMKVTMIEIKLYQLKNTLITLYQNYILNDLKISDIWKIQSVIAIDVISLKINDEEYVIHSNSNNIEIK